MDYVGVDIIARNPHTTEIMGISVKSRSRSTGTETSTLNIPNDNLLKLDAACKAFGCTPYFAIVVDAAEITTVFIVSQAHMIKLCPPGKSVVSWRMHKECVLRYENDPEIRTFRFTTKAGNWWQ